MTDREALDRIRTILEQTATSLRQINRQLGRSEPKLDELEVAVKTGVLSDRLDRPGNEAVIAAVELFCDELIALRARAVLPSA
jgi:hypothetical protein